MSDRHENKEQLIQEVTDLRQRLASINDRNTMIKEERTPTEKSKSRRVQKDADMSFKESEEIFHSLSDGAFEGIVITEKGRVVEANKALLDILSCSREDLIGAEVMSFVAPVDRDKVIKIIESGMTDPYEHKALRKDGVLIDVEVRPSRIQFHSRNLRLTAIRDVTMRKRSEQALRQSEERYRNIVEASPMGMHFYHLEQSKKLIFDGANPAADNILGIEHSQFIGKTIEKAFPNLAKTDVPDIYRRLASKGGHWQAEEIVYKDKRVAGAFEVHAFQTTPDRMAAMFLDRTERKQVEEALQASEEKFRRLFEFAPDGVYLSDLKGVFVDGNRATTMITGYPREQLIGKSFLKAQLLPKKQLPKAAWLLSQSVRGLPTGPDEFTLIRKDGSRIPTEISTYPIEVEDQKLILGIARDITERKQTEEALRENEERFRGTFEQAAVGIAHTNLDLVFTLINDRFCEITGYAKEDLMRMTFKEITHPEDLNADLAYRQRLLTGDLKTFSMEKRYIRKDSETIWVALTVSLIRDTAGEPKDFIAVIEEISERKQAEQELWISQANLVESQRIGRIGSYVVDLASQEWTSSSVLCDIFGFDHNASITSQLWFSIVHPDWQQAMTDHIAHDVLELHGRLDKEYKIIRQNDSAERWVHGRGELKFDDNSTPISIIGTIQDITDRKQAEQIQRVVLEISQAAAVSNNLEDLLKSVREHLGSIIDTTNFYVALYEKSTGGYTFPVYFDQVDTLDTNHEYLPGSLTDLVRQTGKSKIYTEYPDGDQTSDIVLNRYGSDSACWLGAPLITKEGVIGVLALQSYDDPDAYTQKDLQLVDSIVGTIAIALERKRAEENERILNEKLKQAERMESLGLLAGGIAHDLNNILVPMVATPDLILQKLPHDTPVRSDLNQIKKSAEDAARVISDLLTMARRGNYEMVPVSLNDVIGEYRTTAGFQRITDEFHTVNIKFDLADDLQSISGSMPHLYKVIMNLIMNAFHSHESKGTVRVRTRNKHLSKAIHLLKDIPAGDYVVFEVSDKGTGISKEHVEKIFEPFYTTKSKEGGKGTGLGLSIVHGVVNDHNAYLNIESDVGKGTTFCVYFPSTHAVIVDEKTSTANYEGNESILVIDDMPVQIELVKQILTTYGYRVHGELGGKNGVKHLKDNKFDLVVLDMIMEDDYDGLSTYQDILKIHPGQKAIIVTGFSESERVKEAIKIGVTGFINKPYTLQSLGEAVRKALDN
ncbi:PAS domain S-box protein [Candidatus Neomarinimicrobiota bacterium]